MKHRSGITLLEVLVAIFIMGVGLLAILTLFPLGVMTAAQALQDDRVQQLAVNVDRLATARDLRNDTNITGSFNATTTAVYVDPFYAPLGSTTLGTAPNSIPRVQLPASWTPTGGNATRWFTMIDDYNFTVGDPANPPPGGTGGAVPDNTGGTIQSYGIYTCCVLMRRPRPTDPSFDSMAVVVYKGRSTQVIQGETAYAAAGTAGNTTLTVNGPPAPSIRRSGWILDTTVNGTTNAVQADFYQVISMTDNGAGLYTLETATPLKNNVSNIIVLENVIDVIERSWSWH
jgi:hypothetical protein